MQFAQIDQNNIYIGMVDGIPGDVPDSWFGPEGVKVSVRGMPPTDEPGKWRDDSTDWVEVTSEELAAAEYAAAQAEASQILTARAQRQMVQAETFTDTEIAVFAKAGLFPVWAPGETYAKGNRLVHEGIVYEVQQPVTAQAHQPPGSTGMLAIYLPISVDPETGVEPDGSRDNPYAYLPGMNVYNGKYYTFEGKLYLAKADLIPCVWPPNTPGLWQWEEVK